MAVELLFPVPSLESRANRPSPVRPSRLMVMTAALPLPAQMAWLEAHLADAGHGLDPWCAMLGASGEPGPVPADLDDLAAAVGARGLSVTRRVLVGDLRVSLEAMAEGPAVIPALLDDPQGPLARWALRRARHAVLVVPPGVRSGRPRVRLVAERVEELPWLATWAALLPPRTCVELRCALSGLEDRPAVAALRELRVLEAALERTAERLQAAGYQATARPDPLEPEPPPTLLVHAASAGLLRRWLPGNAERALAAGDAAVLAVPRGAALAVRSR